jgi:peptidoglycan/xylan/chitin deacetylase (PgdA/CDA1 family)
LTGLIVTTSAVAAAGAGLGFVAQGLFHPRSQLWGPVIWHGRSERSRANRSIALTFDDGPHPQATPRILDLLDQCHAKATFFVIGKYAQAHPQLLRQIHQAGHLIGNHTWDHHHLGTLHFRRYWDHQLTATNELILELTGSKPEYFRPPMGFRNRFTMAAARDAGLTVVNWTRRGRDGRTTHAAAITRRLVNRCHPGDILTLHDGVDPHTHRPWLPTLEALPVILRHLQDEQFNLVRLDELLNDRAP